jgi:hypothetical protein
MLLSTNVLVESSSARDQSLLSIAAKDSETSILNKVKPIFSALWEASGLTTTEQIADFYEVSLETVKSAVKYHKAEFESDGLRVLDGEELRFARLNFNLANKTRSLTVWNARAVIRLGFLLRDSRVAARVRTVSLNVLQGVGQILDKNVLDNLVDANPACSHMYLKGQIRVSSPLSNYYYSIEKKLKKMYPTGAIPGLSKKDIREKLAALSTYTKSWKCNTQAELSYKLNREQQKYPDLVIPGVSFKLDGEVKKAVFMIHLVDFLVGVDDVESVVGKQFVRRVREHHKADYAFVFLVSPFGGTPDAEYYIKQDIPEELKGFLGIMTVKELAELFVKQAREERKSNLVKGEVRKNFADLLDYKIPVEPLLVMLGEKSLLD